MAWSSKQRREHIQGHRLNSKQWLKIYANYLKIKRDSPMKLYSDKKFAINIDHGPVQCDQTKHIKTDTCIIK